MGLSRIGSASSHNTDSFGGFLKLKGTPGKYSHLESINGRTMLVTPEGHGFFSLGMSHIGDLHGARPNDVVKDHFGGSLVGSGLPEEIEVPLGEVLPTFFRILVPEE